MTVDPARIQELSSRTDLFQRVFSQMTPAECVRALVAAQLIDAPVEIPGYLTAESALSYLHWNNGRGRYYQTSPDYKYEGMVFRDHLTAAEARQQLRERFDASPEKFLSGAVAANRAEKLLQLPGSQAVTSPAKTLVFCWDKKWLTASLKADPKIGERDNVIGCCHAFEGRDDLGSSVARLASELAKCPPGQRAINMGTSQPLWKIRRNRRYCLFDQEFRTPNRQGLSVDHWYESVRAEQSKWRRFWLLLKKAGRARFGEDKADTICDRFVFDAENFRQFWRFRPEWIARDYGYDSRETLDDVFTDDDWPAWRARMPEASPLSQDVWSTWKDWDIDRDQRVFVFDGAMRAYLSNRYYALLEIARHYFPRLEAFEYATCLTAPGTHPSDRAASLDIKPLGNGSHFGGSCVSCYGTFDNARWYWPTFDLQRFKGGTEQFHFAALLTQLTRLGNLINGSSLPRNVYLSYNELSGKGLMLGMDGYWAELILHATLLCGDGANLAGGGIHFYQTGDSVSAASHRRFMDLVAERDKVAGTSGAVAVPPAPIESYDQMFLTSSVVIGRRAVSRVTSNTWGKPRLESNSEGVIVSDRDVTLRFPRGVVHPLSQSQQAPFGWWIEQPWEAA
ncbi:MAG: hypothetical protein K1X71_00055 [Pirellulales bacterium]|nr:hypothetical protein [Pirellulales bacterium]